MVYNRDSKKFCYISPKETASVCWFFFLHASHKCSRIFTIYDENEGTYLRILFAMYKSRSHNPSANTIIVSIFKTNKYARTRVVNLTFLPARFGTRSRLALMILFPVYFFWNSYNIRSIFCRNSHFVVVHLYLVQKMLHNASAVWQHHLFFFIFFLKNKNIFPKK